MKIRPANEADLTKLSELIIHSVSVLNTADDSPKDIAYICTKHDPQHMQQNLYRREVFVLEMNNQLIGTISLGGDRLHSLFVEPDSAKKGYGRILVGHIENLARNNSVSVLKLSSSRTAVAFYEKLRFKKLGFEPREFASTWAMEKRLKPAS
ncbi:MAG: GNAT family N-acetyltransferase [Aestuariivirga sp.]